MSHSESKTTKPPKQFKYGWNSDDLARMADAIHFPEHWDRAAYPYLYDAIYEIVTNAGCSECPKKQ